jgi:hypothetical protein
LSNTESPLQPESSNCSDAPTDRDLEEDDGDIFYGLFIPSEFNTPPGIRLIYTKRQEVVEAARKIKGARFKAFSSRDEAERYERTKTGNDAQSDADTSLIFEGNHNGLSAPKQPELNRLRGSIEMGELESFNRSVQSNPRFLVSSGDTPVALQKSCKWNALHIAARSNQVAIAESLMNSLKDDEFWMKLYPCDTKEAREKRKAYVIDLYLNSPEIGSCATPLHFAAKFGYIEMVEFLLIQPGVDVVAQDKFGQTANDVVGQKCSNDKAAIAEEVRKMLEGKCSCSVKLKGMNKPINYHEVK